MIILPAQVKEALLRLENAGYAAYAVGGCVRDRLMGREPKDYDIATSALPAQTAAVFADCGVISTGIKHGTLTVLSGGMPLEITTFRSDGDYSDARHPDSVRFGVALEDDLARRDFTINAVAYNPRSGLVDPYGGAADIERRQIRCVGDAGARFGEDALRIMRAVRFAAVLGFEIEPQTAAAMVSLSASIAKISAERVAAELSSLLRGKYVTEVILKHPEPLCAALPELGPLRGFAQHNPHHIFDVYEHTARTVGAVEPTLELRLAALLHDIGKPDCFSKDERGCGHFYGHAAVSAQMSVQILARLRFDVASTRMVTELVRRHDERCGDSAAALRRALNRLTPPVFFRLLRLQRADAAAQAPDDWPGEQYYREIAAAARQIMLVGECYERCTLAVNGDDLTALGMAPGREMGALLNLLLRRVVDGELPNDRAVLLAAAEREMDMPRGT